MAATTIRGEVCGHFGQREPYERRSAAESASTILLSVRDGRKVQPPRRRFDLQRRYLAGRHCVAIDLEDLAAGNRFAPLDLSTIQSFHIVVTGLTEPRTLFLHRIALE